MPLSLFPQEALLPEVHTGLPTGPIGNIQFAARQAATVPLPKGFLASKLQVFWVVLSGTVRRIPFTSISGSLGVILVTLGSILVALGAPVQGSGLLWKLFGNGVHC